MTRKDYEAIATIFRDERRFNVEGLNVGALSASDLQHREDVCRHLVGALSDLFASDNPRFDRDRFREACQ